MTFLKELATVRNSAPVPSPGPSANPRMSAASRHHRHRDPPCGSLEDSDILLRDGRVAPGQFRRAGPRRTRDRRGPPGGPSPVEGPTWKAPSPSRGRTRRHRSPLPRRSVRHPLLAAKGRGLHRGDPDRLGHHRPARPDGPTADLRRAARRRARGHPPAGLAGPTRPILERGMLDDFFAFSAGLPVLTWLHWGTAQLHSFGFEVLSQRARRHGLDPEDIPPERRFDLANYLKRLHGCDYAPHPRLWHAIHRNGVASPGSSSEAQAAEAWCRRQIHAALLRSLSRKVDCHRAALRVPARRHVPGRRDRAAFVRASRARPIRPASGRSRREDQGPRGRPTRAERRRAGQCPEACREEREGPVPPPSSSTWPTGNRPRWKRSRRKFTGNRKDQLPSGSTPTSAGPTRSSSRWRPTSVSSRSAGYHPQLPAGTTDDEFPDKSANKSPINRLPVAFASTGLSPRLPGWSRRRHPGGES